MADGNWAKLTVNHMTHAHIHPTWLGFLGSRCEIRWCTVFTIARSWPSDPRWKIKGSVKCKVVCLTTVTFRFSAKVSTVHVTLQLWPSTFQWRDSTVQVTLQHYCDLQIFSEGSVQCKLHYNLWPSEFQWRVSTVQVTLQLWPDLQWRVNTVQVILQLWPSDFQ